MLLESLPNEIFFDIFDYFTGAELLSIFYGLNMRLNSLLHQQFLHCSFEFSSSSKQIFELICRQHIPRMSDLMQTITLSDYEETPTQCNLFLHHFPTFHRFNHLQSLTITHVRSYHTLSRLINLCHDLPEMTRLNLIACYIQDIRVDCQSIINQIWSLPKLTHCHMGICVKGQPLFRTPIDVSSSITSICIANMQLKLNQIHQLYECTPNLTTLSASVVSFAENDYVPKSMPTLTSLEIRSLCTCEATSIGNFLQSTPNLLQLRIDLSSEVINGTLWEEIIGSHLRQLETLQLKMKTILPLRVNIQQHVKELMTTFQSSFWLKERQWFVRCLIAERTLHLYSLSEKFEGNLPVTFNSTNLEDDERKFYRTVTNIEYPSFFNLKEAAFICPNTIKHLHLNLPLNNRFFSSIVKFERLECLKVLFHANSFRAHVQELLNRSPRLKKLIISQNDSTLFQTAIFKYTHGCIRELDLRNINHVFNEDDCLKLSQSPLGQQCEKLSLMMRNFKNISVLVEKMPKLRCVKVNCGSWTDSDILWLRTHLGSNAIISEDPQDKWHILVWI